MNIELIKIGFTIPLFFYATYTDYKDRRVSNKVWLPLIGLALVVFFFEFSISYLIKLCLSIGVMFPLAYLLMYFDFGGADAKFLMVVAILFPEYPAVFNPFYVEGWIFSFTVLLNALILALVYPLTIFLVNLKKKNFTNPLKMIIALPKKPGCVNEDDKVIGDKIFLGKQVEDVKEKEKVWVSPKIPFIIPLVAGYFVSLVYGDIWLSLIL
ncbi:hypothetical protein C9439_05640 [archaeon SCG-AAA382B04]|nr:hypothetical protein C9439_05640 [archaeon SCG-AAA382B04]